MLIHSESVLGYFMRFWPFAVALIFVVLYWRRVKLRNSLMLLVLGVILGYGVQTFLAYPVYLLIIAVAKILISNSFMFSSAEAIAVIYGFALLTTAILMWLLARALRVRPSVDGNGT